MKAIWTIYSAWLNANFPEGAKALNPGATVDELAYLESTIGIKLPPDYRSWLTVHNGQRVDGPTLLCSNEFLSTHRIVDEWQAMMKVAENRTEEFASESIPPNAIKPDWWNSLWIPITSDGSGNLECPDMSPGPAGAIGQIIDFDHETVERTLLASSFRHWVSDYVDCVEAGDYAYSDDYGRFMLCDDM